MQDKTHPDFSMIIASAVHDMKNSLGMLLHSVDTLCDTLPVSEQNQQSVAVVKYEAERVNSYLIQLLGLYRLQNKKLSIHVDEHFVSDLLDEQIAQYQAMLDGKNVSLKTDCESDLVWFFDRELVLGILNNALNNASRYTKSAIEIVASESDGYLTIEVHDDGQGYPSEMLKAEPGDIMNNIKFSTGSTSLGLYFASEVAKLHQQQGKQGSIKLSNGGRLGGGVFSIYLP